VVAIGGIGVGQASEVMATPGVDGIAVVSAICGAPDPEAAARDLRREIDAGRERVPSS
jgi:thiamine-phosphate pyrophosphorylase